MGLPGGALLACAVTVLVTAGCTSEPAPQPPPDSAASASGSASGSASAPGSAPGSASGSASGTTDGAAEPPRARTIDLRYTVTPRSAKLFQVTLPPQQPGGTMVTWSAYFQGIGNAARPDIPLKVECYVVQAAGPAFEDRVFYTAEDSSETDGEDIALSASGVVDTADGEVLTFECEIDENRDRPIPGLQWQTNPLAPIQVTLTPLADRDQRNLTIRR